jgi:hypothetical protein
MELIGEAPHEFTVPAHAPHAHPWNLGSEPLRVRQVIASDEPIPEIAGGVQGYFETFFAFAQAGEVDEDGDIRGRLQNALTIYSLLVPATFLDGPPRWMQRGAFAGISAAARAAGKRPYRRPEFD